MGRREAARYIVADASRDDERGRRRAATHHRYRRHPHDGLGPGRRAAHRVRARRRAGAGPRRTRGAAARARSAARQHVLPALGDEGRRPGQPGRRGGRGVGSRCGVLSVGCGGPGPRGPGLPQDRHHLFSGDQCRAPLLRRSGGRAVCLVAILLTVGRPDRLSAQGFLSQFSYDNLKPSALQLDLGPVGGNNIRGTLTGGLRLDYGFIAPHVRVLLGVAYYKADFSAAARARFAQRLDSIVNPSTPDTINLGRITWSDVTGDVDLQYVLPQGHAVIAYMGIGLGAHIRHGSGPAINGTFVQDALNEITAGLNGTVGAEFSAKRWRFTLEARGVLSSGLSTASLRSGVMYRWAGK